MSTVKPRTFLRPGHRTGFRHIVDSEKRNEAFCEALWEYNWPLLDDLRPSFSHNIQPGDMLEDHYITSKQMKKTYLGVRHLNCTGKIFNTLYSCSWASVGVMFDNEVNEAITRQIELFRQWGNHRGFSIPFIWVVERGRRRGLHYHVLLHIPADLQPEFAREVANSVETISGSPPLRATSDDDTETVDITHFTDVARQWWYWRYLMKGIYHQAAMKCVKNGRKIIVPINEFLGLEEFRYQGRYAFQRSGTSTNIGLKAQADLLMNNGPCHDAFDNYLEPKYLYGDQYLEWSNIKWLRSLE